LRGGRRKGKGKEGKDTRRKRKREEGEDGLGEYSLYGMGNRGYIWWMLYRVHRNGDR